MDEGKNMELGQFIDHTLLRPDCTRRDIENMCSEAIKHQFKAVCVPPYYVKDAADVLAESMVRLATVIGFPMGYSATPAKVEEIKRALNEGADELDVVANISALKNGDWAHVRNDIDSVTRAVHLKGKEIKIIIEAGLLEPEEVKKICGICANLEVDFVKTSTGINGKGASPEMVATMRSYLPRSVKIKASGGIRTKSQALQLLQSGANRLGCSSSIAIINE